MVGNSPERNARSKRLYILMDGVFASNSNQSDIVRNNLFPIRLWKAKEKFDDIQCETKKRKEKELYTRVGRDIGLYHCGRLRF